MLWSGRCFVGQLKWHYYFKADVPAHVEYTGLYTGRHGRVIKIF
jgi:hypothetical protein